MSGLETKRQGGLRAGAVRRWRVSGSRRGFTLLEALIASGILLMVVVGVTVGISAGQQHSYEAHQRIAAALAAEELLGRVASDSYANLNTWDGYAENIGQMVDMKGVKMPNAFGMLGRNVTVTTSLLTVNATLGIKVNGKTVQVSAFNAEHRTLASVSRFIPEPQS